MKRPQYNLSPEKSERIRKVLFNLNRDAVFTKINRYDGPLGAIYQKDATEFKLWAPSASQVELLIYDSYYGNLKKSVVMDKSADERIFYLHLSGDLHGLTYNYRLTFMDGTQNISVDPYARATTVNGQRTVVVDLDQTNPDGWGERMRPWENPAKTVVYEMHVRDFTVSNTSNIKHKGHFVGVVEENRHNQAGSPVGIDYLVDLGVSHVEFLPLFDYYTVDETEQPPSQYNWGYDPYNYNVPEGSYATNPYDPFVRIKEMKQMIQKLHHKGLRVIMDVVYNHVYEVDNHSFHLTAPGYYFRYNEKGDFTNGTGVGNDTASERHMVRKYIVDSVTYWAKEYHIDGFRFDLMGIHDVETMNAVRQALDEIDPTILLFGEGWSLFTPLTDDKNANQNNANFMPRIGHFNDGIREGLKGNEFEDDAKGFVNGAWHMESKVVSNFMGGVDFGNYQDPLQLIQYAEAHDNKTLYDKFKGVSPDTDEAIIVKQHQLATTIILLAQGIPFIHAGQEFLRTKFGVKNSFNSPDSINQIDWNRQDEHRETVNLVRDLIQLRQQEPLFTLTSYEQIRQVMEVEREDYQIIHLTYQGQTHGLTVIFNAQNNQIDVPLPKQEYIVKLYDNQVYLRDDKVIDLKGSMPVPALTALVLKYDLEN